MKAIAMALLVCAACGGSDDVEFYPINPGGGGSVGGVSGSGSGSQAVDGDAGVEITGRVCLITDARNPLTCAATGAGGLTVTLGTRTATTMADGTFSLRVITGASNVWGVTGTGIVSSAMTFGASGATNNIPALTTTVYTDMISANPTASVPAGTGSIIAKLTRNNGAIIGATVVTAPQTAGAVLYDGADNVNWSQNGTGVLGIAWAPGITPGTATMTVTAVASQQITGIPVVANAITWVFADLP